MISNRIKIIGSIVSFLIYTGMLWNFATTYQKNKDDIKAKEILIKQQKASISILTAEKLNNENLILQLESQRNVFTATIESQSKEINRDLQFIQANKKYINNNNFINDNFVRLLSGTYPYNTSMPENTSFGFETESTNRNRAADTALYCREWRGYAEKYVENFKACRNQYNTVMENNNSFIRNSKHE